MTESYKKFTQIEHVLARPGMYIGDTKCTTADAWTINDENKAGGKHLFITCIIKMLDIL